MLGILLVVLRHVTLHIAAAVDLSAFEAEPDLAHCVASLARVPNLDSLLKQMV